MRSRSYPHAQLLALSLMTWLALWAGARAFEAPELAAQAERESP